MREIYDWDTGKYLGNIPEVPHTYNVVGNINEFGLTIGETTFGGIASLQEQKGGIVDYGSLIWITLQRAKTAREAIKVMGELVATYGYASEGESFSIADGNEAWILELIGKGDYELGAVWVAMKLPEGSITAHANQARITTFPLNDPENCVYSPDVISFARKIGLYPQDASDETFSFSDIYDPLTFSGARFCEARVWSIFSNILGQEFSDEYLTYAQGYNLTHRMPLFIYPPKDTKLTVLDVSALMRNHYEKTPLDMSGQQFPDVGATTYSIFRTHPLSWSSNVNPVDGVESKTTTYSYFHERPIATPQTGWNFIAQTRNYLPEPVKGLLWFGVDDVSTTVRTPVYASATRLPEGFVGKGPQDGVVPPMMTFDWKSAFYVFNVVANFAYSRWDLISPELIQVIVDKEKYFMEQVERIDNEAVSRFGTQGVAKTVEFLTTHSVQWGEALLQDWQKLFGTMFVKFRDGYIVQENKENPACGCKVASQGYPTAWYDRIARDTGLHYYTPGSGTPSEQKLTTTPGVSDRPAHLQPVPKSSLKALQ